MSHSSEWPHSLKLAPGVIFHRTRGLPCVNSHVVTKSQGPDYPTMMPIQVSEELIPPPILDLPHYVWYMDSIHKNGLNVAGKDFPPDCVRCSLSGAERLTSLF